MEFEKEIKNFIAVWLSAVASLFYCYTIGKIIPTGSMSRLLAIIPVICIFLILPLHLHFINFVGPSAFFLAWLANFKLLLFAFGKGPLSSKSKPPGPPLSLPSFIAVACFPIKIKGNPSSHGHDITKNAHKLLVKFGSKLLFLMATFSLIYHNKENVHADILLFSYCIYVYFSLELNLILGGALARSLIGVELEPQFHEPYLASSLQDFWGKRWNLMVSDVLRSAVYDPVTAISSHLISRKWAPVPAILATFLVSGVMHELIFYYYGRAKPTWDVTCFFLLHGLCLVLEIVVKRALNGDKRRLWLPRILTGPLVVAFVVVTGNRLFIPALLRNGVDVKARNELIALLEFFKGINLSSFSTRF